MEPQRRTADDLPRHPIAVVAERTGLSQDVLRVWERRYRAVEPNRGPGGHRTYSDADVRRLRLLNAATSAGRSIGNVARLSNEELERMTLEDAAERAERVESERTEPRSVQPKGDTPRVGAEVMEQALALTEQLEAAELQHVLRRAVAQLGVYGFIEGVASPLLKRIGEEWHSGRLTIAHEHLASSTIHDTVAESMRAMVPRSGAPTVLVATPSGERHGIGAALVGAAAATDGWRVLYLGADLPANEIATAAITTAARVVAVSSTFLSDRGRTLDELRALRALLPPQVVVVVGGAGAAVMAEELAKAGIRVGESLTDLRDVLNEAVA